jgi:Icc-related predicted phosphoesterase
MKLALASDLHLEFEDIVLKNTGDAEVLILSGDILTAEDLHNHAPVDHNSQNPIILENLGRRQATALRFRDFLKRCSFEFPHVVYVAGNHEFYHGLWKASLQHLRDECARFDNVYFLEQDVKVINNVTFVGATLWTDCNRGDPMTLHALTDMMNDFRVIRNDEHGYTKLRPAHIMHRHQQTVSYFRSVLADRKDDKVVVVGHHAPSYQSIAEQYRKDYLMNGGYYSNLDEFILDHPQVVLWTHGHTHVPFDYHIGSTRIACNPRGYAGHDPAADTFELKFLEI